MANALVWLRRDLRLNDNPALAQAISDGYRPLLVYIHDENEAGEWAPGAASKVWLHHSLLSLQQNIAERGGRLLLAKGNSQQELHRLQLETQAEALYFSNLYEPALRARDDAVAELFDQRGLAVYRSNSGLLFEPWQIQTGGGTPYKVFTPFWRNASAQLALRNVFSCPETLPDWPTLESLSVEQLNLLPAKPWHSQFWEYWQPGEAGAEEMLEIFCDGAVNGYREQRNLPDRTGTSKLSPHLHFGEISPHQIWRRIAALPGDESLAGDLTHFRSELGWREFSAHLLHHFPQSGNENLNPNFRYFQWQTPDPELLQRWQKGRTGIPIVDAGMRELWHTGWMHNRVRMIVASFLCKNLRYHWLHGARWFWDTLLDADLANNSQGWQWTAGTGCDAAPYFRIFNPVTQAERFDASARYIKKWVPELTGMPVPHVFAPWQKPDILKLHAPDYPVRPMVDLSISRQLALEAYSRR